MIQDQYEPELYVGSFDQVETATGQRLLLHVKYADTIEQQPGFINDFDGASAKTMDRQVSCGARLTVLYWKSVEYEYNIV